MRTRLRRLHTDGRTYTWRAAVHHVRGDRDRHRCIRLRVWGAGKNGLALQADLLSTAWGLPWGCATDGSHPTPGDVRTVIAHALSHGWTPDALGGTFHLTARAHSTGWSLPGYLLTDRLNDPTAPDPTTQVIAARS